MTEEINPYQAPLSEVADVGIGEMVPAAKGRRFGTFVVDYACYMFLGFCVGVLIALVGGEAGIAAFQRIPDLLFGCFLLFAYYVFFEGLWSRTPGKLLFGTVVVTEGGGKPTFSQVMGRTACRFIPFEVFSCLGERAWHDSIPKTRVVMAKGR